MFIKKFASFLSPRILDVLQCLTYRPVHMYPKFVHHVLRNKPLLIRTFLLSCDIVATIIQPLQLKMLSLESKTVKSLIS